VSYRDVESIDPEFAKNLQVNCGIMCTYIYYTKTFQENLMCSMLV